jgi:hypothetical protein
MMGDYLEMGACCRRLPYPIKKSLAIIFAGPSSTSSVYVLVAAKGWAAATSPDLGFLLKLRISSTRTFVPPSAYSGPAPAMPSLERL